MTKFHQKLFDRRRVERTCVNRIAQAAAPTPWELKSDMAYAYGKDGKTSAYTNN